MLLSNLSIKRPVFATVLILALVTVGVFSYRRLAIDMMPDVEIPVLSIVTVFPGASPETVEREITKRIEEAVNPISGVKHVMSTSREGLSSVVVEFQLEVKINEASQEARAKINAIRRDLPQNIDDPIIQKLDFQAMPIVSLAVRSSVLGPRDLTTLADRKIKRRIENISGVGKVKLVGSSKREVAVNIDPVRLQALGMGVDEVVAGLQGENVNTPLGRLTRGGSEMPLRVSGKPAEPQAYTDMVIARRGDHPVTLGEIADIVDGVEEERSAAMINGNPAVSLDVLKQSKANTVEVVDTVKKTVLKLQQEMPAGTEIDIVRDSSVMIRDSVHDVQITLILGGVLTVLIVFCFLNSWRSTVITGLTLPISVISSFIAMYFFGMTINVMTLMALSLAIGLLIDDAIVVRENIVRHLEHGEDHFTAAREGTSEIGLAVLATSLSIIAVFVPVAFMKGIIGRFFFQFGLTVAFAVLVSLFVSFTLDPMLSSRWHDPDIDRTGKRNPLKRSLDRFNDLFDRTADRYKGLISWALDHRKTVMAAATAAFVAGIALFGTLQTEFMPPFDHGEFVLRFKTAPGASIAETRSRLTEVLAGLREFPEVRHSYASIAAGESDTVRDAMVFVKLKERAERTRSQASLLPLVRARLERVAGLQLSLQDDPDAFEKPLQINIRGDEIPKLKEIAAALKGEMYAIPGIKDLEASLELDLPEYRLTVDRERAATAGLGTEAVARTVGLLIGGQAVTTYEDSEGEAVDVRIRLPLDLRQDVTQIGNLRLAVPSPDGTVLVPLADLITFERTKSPSEINRRDLARQVVISANLDGLPLGTASEKALAAGARLKLPPGYTITAAGDTEIMMESFRYMGEALILAIIFVYLILAAQFESFVDPLAIMLSLPLSIVGMAGMLALTGDTINIMSLIGLILLMGLVTKNAILLVDFAKTRRRAGVDRRSALIEAGRIRLRPIMMTTLAMIFGMMPLALAIGQGAEMRAPMARAVVGGLLTSTILTLIVVPVVYTVFDDIVVWLVARRRTAPVKAGVTAVGALFAAIFLLPAPASAAATMPAMANVSGTSQPALPATANVSGSISRTVPSPSDVSGSALQTLPTTANVSGTSQPTLPATANVSNAAQRSLPVPAHTSGSTLQSDPVASSVSSAAGFTPNSALRSVTLDEALAIAAEKNLDIQKAEEYRRWLRARYVEARADAFPQVTLTGNVLRNFDESQKDFFQDVPEEFKALIAFRQDVKGAQLTLDQVLFSWGQVGAAIRGAKWALATGDDQLRRFQQAVRRDVTTSFCDVLLAREFAAIAEHTVAQRRRHLDEAQRRLTLGTATDFDVLSAQVALDNARPEAIRAANSVRTARQQLAFLLAEEGELDANGSLATASSRASSYDDVVARALENRPELVEIGHLRQVGAELVKIKGADDRPRLDFHAGLGFKRLEVLDKTSRGKTWNAGVVLSYPIFDGWRTRAKVAQAKSDLATVSLSEQKLKDAVALEARAALDAVEQAREILHALDTTVRQAERLLEMAERGYEFGVKTKLDVDDAELNLRAARGNLARAQRDHRVALVNLDWVAGTLGEATRN